MIAMGIAGELGRFGILTETPDHQPGDEAYSRPLRNMLRDGRL